MNTLHVKTVGLAVGTMAALVHAVWALVVAIMPHAAQSFLEWHRALHFMSMPIELMPFTLGGAVMLVVVAFISGYIVGSVFAKVYNWAVSRN